MVLEDIVHLSVMFMTRSQVLLSQASDDMQMCRWARGGLASLVSVSGGTLWVSLEGQSDSMSENNPTHHK